MLLVEALVIGGFPLQAARVVGWGEDNRFSQQTAPANLTNAVALAAGSFHSLARRTDGTVTAWGLNNVGQATPPPNLSGVAAISAGANHSMALLSSGTVVAWGDGAGGQTNVPPALAGVVAIAAGQFHNLALRGDGRVVGWGFTGWNAERPPAELTNGLSIATAIAAGGNHSLAIKTSFSGGRVVAWGNNSFGQARPPTELTNGVINVVAIAAGENHSLALKADGTVAGWGYNAFGQATAPPGLNGVIAIAAGGNDSLALRSDGTVVSWGYRGAGANLPPAGLNQVVAIAVGSSHSLALVREPPMITAQPQSQTVVAGGTATFTVSAAGGMPLDYRWFHNGTNIPGATASSYTVTDAQTSHAGQYVVTVSNSDGSVTSAPATLTVNSPPTINQHPQSQAVNAGQNAVFTVSAAGSGSLRYQWRKNGQNIPNAINSFYGITSAQPSDAGNYDVIVTNNFGAVTSLVAVLSVNSPPVITQQPQSQTVSAGSSVSFSVGASNATFFQWRKNGAPITGANSPVYSINNAQLEDAAGYSVRVTNQFGMTDSATALLTVTEQPTGPSDVVAWGQILVFNGSEYVDTSPPGGLTGIKAIAAGRNHSLALKTDGMVAGWGDNSLGQAAPPPGLSQVSAIAAGDFHSLALRMDGTVVAWGDNSSGQATVPPGLTMVAAIAAGGGHSLALREDGAVVGWGANMLGQATAPPGITNLIAIAAGAQHSLGLRADGTATGWGGNDHGQARPPTALANVVALVAGAAHSAALKSDGTVVVWGANNLGQTNVPPGLAAIIAIVAGANHTLALRADGAVLAWGHNNYGQIEVPADLSSAVGLGAGGDRSLALKRKRLQISLPAPQADGTFRLWIRNADGSAIEASRIGKIRVYVSADPTHPFPQWTLLNTPLVSDGGRLRLDDPAVGLSQRFYRLAEQP